MNNPRLWLGLSILAAGVVLAVTLHRSGTRASGPGRVVPELMDGELVELSITRPQHPRIVLARRAGALQLVAPVRTPVNRSAVNTVVRHLGELRADGRDDGEGIGPALLTVGLRFSNGTGLTLELSSTGTIYRPDLKRVYAVDGDRVKALLDAAARLRRRRLFATPAAAVSGLELNAGELSLVMSGKPLELHRDEGGTAPVRPALLKPVIDQLVGARMARFVATTAQPAPGSYTLVLIGAEGRERVQNLGACPNAPSLWLVTSPAGTGCVDPAPFQALQKLAAKLRPPAP